jgi:hypothetical protein
MHRCGAHVGSGGGSPGPESLVCMGALMATLAEGIWRQRHGPEVDGASSRFGKHHWTGAQLLAVVDGPGAGQSGLAMGRHPQQRKQTASATSVLGNRWLLAWRRGSRTCGGGG